MDPNKVNNAQEINGRLELHGDTQYVPIMSTRIIKLKYIVLYFQTIYTYFEINTLFENLSEHVDYIEINKIKFDFYIVVGIIFKRHLESDYITVKYMVGTAKGHFIFTF